MTGPRRVPQPDHPISVLVVDDDFRVAALHAEVVKGLDGLTVVAIAHTASAALDAARRHRPDLVLLDLYLPDEHGLTLLHKLREGTGPHPDVIAITAARDLDSIRSAMQHGVVQYLVKPFPLRTLVERLQAYRTLWLQARGQGNVSQQEVDRLFALMRIVPGTSPLPKGLSEPTMALVRDQFDTPAAEYSAADIAERIGVSRATAQRYLALLVQEGTLQRSLRYGSAGRPEHRFRKTGD
jgi:two-component system CitB family response regulator